MADLPDLEAQRQQTMMKLRDLRSLSDEQRIAIMEMIKEGSLTMEEATAEVKRVRPKTFPAKYLGSCPAILQGAVIDSERKDEILAEAAQWLKKSKPAAEKVTLTVSTSSVQLRSATTEEILEAESMVDVVHFGILPGNKKVLAFVVRYTKLGLLFSYLCQFAKPREAEEALEIFQDRSQNATSSTLAKLGSLSEEAEDGGDGAAAAEDEDSSDDEGEGDDEDWEPFAVFALHYLGTVGAPEAQGDESVRASVMALLEQLRAKHGKIKDMPYEHATKVVVVVSAEGVRTVERHTRDLVHNIIIKAISYTTQIMGKKSELFAFIEVDDRRNSNDCHIFLCEKGFKNQAAEVCEAMAKAFQLARKKAGNPFKAVAGSKEAVEGPLATHQLKRKRLRAVKAIGAGQFGRVYLAELKPKVNQTTAGDDDPPFVAVKILRSAASEEDKKEFIREAETMLSLGSHKNLVAFQGVVIRNRPWMVVLEFCQYGDLSDVLRVLRRKKLSLTLPEQLLFLSQISSALEYISSRGYVHMDLACRNCLLHRGNVLKVADFGLTHKFDEGKSYYKQVGVLKLSIRWLAIDALDYKIFSEKSDVWSFGVTAWEIASLGKQPYHGLGLQDVIKAVRAGQRLEQPTDCPDALWEILQSCWIKEPTRRPTFRQIRKALTYVSSKYAGNEEPRDVGELLNKGLTTHLKQLSMRKRKQPGGKAVPQAGAISEEEEEIQREMTLKRKNKISLQEED